MLGVLALALAACSSSEQPTSSSSPAPQCTRNDDCAQPSSVCMWSDCVQGQCVEETILGCSGGSGGTGGTAGAGGTGAAAGSGGAAGQANACTYDSDCGQSADPCMKVTCLQGLCVSMQVPHCGEPGDAGVGDTGPDDASSGADADAATPPNDAGSGADADSATCKATGEACSAGTECCSGNCKGNNQCQ